MNTECAGILRKLLHIRASAGTRGTRLRAAALLLLLCVGSRAGAQQVGTIAQVEGTVELGRAGTWTSAAVGSAVERGDSLRTGRPGGVRVVFQDDSVLAMADTSELRIDEEVVDSNRGVAHSLFRLLQGKVRTVVSEYYQRPGSVFTIETVTAVVGVRGSEFVIVFDPVAEVTDVVGVNGRAEVHSTLDRVGHAVFVTAREITTVMRSRYPTAPRRLRDEEFRQYLDHVEFIGAGKPEGVVAGLPLVTGAGVPEGERATLLPGVTGAGVQPPVATSAGYDKPPDVSSILQQPPPVLEQSGIVGIRF
ncbi:MAG TPA: FecR domain-containing protein [Candidatus Margulisiibacteriota bacterium]|nr:FecR domain-containing protein [Candidatus Margulisiibacteriota bacterium]